MLRSQLKTRGGRLSARLAAVVATVLAAGTLAVLPAAPASASFQSAYFTTYPSGSAPLGSTVSFAWAGTASFFGPYITGCFVNYTDGNNYYSSFNGTYTSGNCSLSRTMYNLGNIQIQVGFSLSNGGSVSTSAYVYVYATAPYMTNNPPGATYVASGNTASISANAGGTPFPSVQWQLSTNGGSSYANIPGANWTTYTTPPTVFADSGRLYRAVFWNFAGSTTSWVSQLVVSPRSASITTNPDSASTPTGTPVDFTAHGDADPAATVQWWVSRDAGLTYDPATEASATSDTLTVTPSYADNGNLYQARFSNLGGSTPTTAAQLTVVGSVPAVTLSPTNVATLSGQPVTLSAAGTGDPAPTVQWQRSDNLGISFADISGATSPDYTFSPTQADDQSLYQAVFTSLGGVTTTAAATLSVSTSIALVTEPAAVTVLDGGAATFASAATGSPTPTVRWQVSTDNGTAFADLPGATDGTLSFDAGPDQDQGLYRAVWTNSTGSLASSAVRLTVMPKPEPVTPPISEPKPKPGTHASPKRPTTQVAQGTVLLGAATTLTGHAKPGAVVTVYGYTQPSTTYRKLGTVRASAKGVYTYRVRLTANSRLYVRVAGVRASRTVLEQVRSTLSLTATKVGAFRYVFTGTVGPHRGHQLVTLYYRIQYGQLVLATAWTDSAGRFSIDRSLRAYGQHYYSVFAEVGTDRVTLGNTSVDRSIAVNRAR